MNSLMIVSKNPNNKNELCFWKFVNIFNESVDKFNWICGWIQMNLSMNSNEFVYELKKIVDELLMNSSEFIVEYSW